MEHADSLDTNASSSSDDQSEDYRARATIEKLLDVVDKSITTSDDENVHGKIIKSNSADLAGLSALSVNKRATHHLPDRDKRIVLNQDIDNTPSENLNENKVGNFEVSKTDLKKACELQDCSQTEKLKSNDPLQCDGNDPFEKFGVNQSVELDVLDFDKFLMNHIQDSSETLGEVFSIPELSNVPDIEALLKSHQELSESSKNPSMGLEEESNDKEENNNVEKSSCNFTTHCELETETYGDNSCSPVFFNSCSFAGSDICKSDSKIDSLPLVKSCFVVLQRCDSLENEYFTNMKHSANFRASLLDMDAMSNISYTEKVNERISKDMKLNTRERKFRKSHTMSNSDIDVAEPHQETSDIKKAKRKKECSSFNHSVIFNGDEITNMKCNANKREENLVKECTSRLSLSMSDASDIVDITQDTLNTNDKSKSPLQNDNTERDFGDSVVSKKKGKGYLNIIKENRRINKGKIKKKAKKRTKKILVEHSIAQTRNTSNFESLENFNTNKEGIKKQGKRKSNMKDTLEINDTNKIYNKNFKTNEAQEECAKNDNGLQFDVYQTEHFILSEHGGETVTDRRKKRSDSNTSKYNSDSYGICNNGINTLKLFKRNEKNIMKFRENSIEQFSIDNISEIGDKSDRNILLIDKYSSKMTKKDHHQQLNKSDDSEIDSDSNTSKENFKTHEYMKRKEVFETISAQTSVCIERTEDELSSTKSQSHKKFMHVEQKKKNKPNYADKEHIHKQKEKNKPNYADKEHIHDELSDASSCSLICLFDQQEMHLDYSLQTKPCHVVLTRCDYADSEKTIRSSSNTPSYFSSHSDLNELSDLDCEDPQDWKGEKIHAKTPNLFSISSDQYEGSRKEFVKTAEEQKMKLKISDLNEVRSTESTYISIDTSDTEIHLSTNKSSEQFRKKSPRKSKHKKFQSALQNRAKACAPDPSTSKGSGVNEKLLEFYKNEFTHEFKELKRVMKRTERKMDILIKLHKQVLNC